MIVIVCGTRGAVGQAETINLYNELQQIELHNPHMRIIAGECPNSADMLAKEYAEKEGIPYEGFPAAWDVLGKKAGHMRNQSMADYADMEQSQAMCVAVWDGKSPGTLDMMKRAVKKGFFVTVIPATVD